VSKDTLLGFTGLDRNRVILPLFGQASFDYVINTDGGARNNPGPGGIGFVIRDFKSGKIIQQFKKYIGRTTNNCAEYIAVLEGLLFARGMGVKRVKIRSDSELLVKQMQGLYRVKDEKLKKYYQEIKRISGDFEIIHYEHVRRTANKEADKLVNEAIDEYFRDKK